jgi:hypothetical protein
MFCYETVEKPTLEFLIKLMDDNILKECLQQYMIQ